MGGSMEDGLYHSTPYSIGLVATFTAAAVLGLSASSTTLVPAQHIGIKTPVAIHKPWEEYDTTSSVAFEEGSDMLAQLEAVQAFSNSLLDGLIDLDPEVVEVVNENFWDILS